MEKRWKWLKAFIKFVFIQFNRKQASAMAAELTLSNMLALVPLMTVAVSLMAVFPAFESVNAQVQSLIFDNLLPETGLAVQEHLNEYVSKSKNLSAIGFGFLIVTSLMLMRSIDRSINALWETPTQRKGIHKILAYWAMLTMAPILIAASLAASSYFAALPIVSHLSGVLTIGLPFILIVLAFSALYTVVPFTQVKFYKALIAATITAILFESAKYGFAIFVTKFSSYELIYGAITAIPIFFLWVYLSWSILLLGVIICFGLHRFEMDSEKHEHEFISILKILQFFTQAQEKESSLSLQQLKSKFSYLHEQTVRGYLEQLLRLNFLAKLESEQYCLKLTGRSLTIDEVYRRGNWRLPNNNQVLSDDKDDIFSQPIEQANLELDKALEISLVPSNSKDS
ncbi:MAG: YihY family inner membrane protein [Kangiella sp.]|nr:YihY family inner membrane protein [Kangiella sp.]